uniref:t-SNARE coiled-coil homology domain-containing protein n=1 Tax=Parastrongyloides trichosuri TaxID=131310 RepID=A0A0N4ZA43_PARTI
MTSIDGTIREIKDEIFYLNHHIEVITNETASLHETINNALSGVDGALSGVNRQAKIISMDVSDTAKSFPRTSTYLIIIFIIEVIIVLFALWLLYLIFKLWKKLPQRKNGNKIITIERKVYKKPYIMIPMTPPPQYSEETSIEQFNVPILEDIKTERYFNNSLIG